MFGTWVDCTAVGNWLYQQISSAIAPVPLPIPATTFKGFCDAGMLAAGAYVDNLILGSTSAKTQIEIQGSCGAGTPLGAGRLALKLVNGAWTGTITEDTFTAPLTGTFTGQRQ